jgi:N-acetylglucosamine-6-phosphate deacetylase
LLIGVRAALVDGQVVAGDVEVEAGVVAAVGIEPSFGATGLAVPGFVDAHINGIGGVDFLGDDEPDYAQARLALTATGVTAFAPTFVTADPRRTAAALTQLGKAIDRPGPRVLGAHLEGPFLSPRWSGAHDPTHLQAPDPSLVRALAEIAPVRIVTLAPELPGALELIGALVADGIAVSCGHSDATGEDAHRAFDAGASAITHIYNAQRRWSPRDPGLAGAALSRDDVLIQMIADNVHLAPETTKVTWLAARSRLCLVSDAIAAAGGAADRGTLGGRAVAIESGAPRLSDGTLAGSLLTMDAAFRNLVACGAQLHEASHAASTAPARLLGRPDLGRLAVGAAADIAVLDDELCVTATYVAGEPVSAAAGQDAG